MSQGPADDAPVDNAPVERAPADKATAALNQVLSEVIDVVMAVKQAHRKVPETHALHAELDRLFEDLGTWAQVLMARDDALGVSALGNMPSVAGRQPPNLWPGQAGDDDVHRVIGESLDRLAEHVTRARAEQQDEESTAALAGVERGVLDHRRALAQL